MKRKKEIKCYCKFCRQSAIVKVQQVKKKKARETSRGQRKFREVTSGFGGFPRPKPTPKVQGKIKRINLRMLCTVCNKSFHPKGIKAKNFEFIRGS